MTSLNNFLTSTVLIFGSLFFLNSSLAADVSENFFDAANGAYDFESAICQNGRQLPLGGESGSYKIEVNQLTIDNGKVFQDIVMNYQGASCEVTGAGFIEPITSNTIDSKTTGLVELNVVFNKKDTDDESVGCSCKYKGFSMPGVCSLVIIPWLESMQPEKLVTNYSISETESGLRALTTTALLPGGTDYPEQPKTNFQKYCNSDKKSREAGFEPSNEPPTTTFIEHF